jgi:glyoxylase-like metal-dependent hydrolase (beta-lactamase superfamily II)
MWNRIGQIQEHMFQVKQHGLVTVFKMGRSVGKTTLYPVHAFLVDETLIDSGSRHVRHAFSAEMEHRRITTLINTHPHEDHIGNNRWLQDRFPLTILAHAAAIPYIEDPRKLNLRPYQRMVWGQPDPSKADPIDPFFDTGRFRLDILPSPGHCPGHIALYEASQGWLFTGDLFCGMGFKYLRSDEAYPTILDSLNRLTDLEFDTLFCSLLGVVTNGKAALRRKISVMEELQAKTLHLNRQGFSPRAIRNRLLGREGAMRWVTGGHYAKQNTIDSILF